MITLSAQGEVRHSTEQEDSKTEQGEEDESSMRRKRLINHVATLVISV